MVSRPPPEAPGRPGQPPSSAGAAEHPAITYGWPGGARDQPRCPALAGWRHASGCDTSSPRRRAPARLTAPWRANGFSCPALADSPRRSAPGPGAAPARAGPRSAAGHAPADPLAAATSGLYDALWDLHGGCHRLPPLPAPQLRPGPWLGRRPAGRPRYAGHGIDDPAAVPAPGWQRHRGARA